MKANLFAAAAISVLVQTNAYIMYSKRTNNFPSNTGNMKIRSSLKDILPKLRFNGESMIESSPRDKPVRFLQSIVKFFIVNVVLFGSSRYSFAEAESAVSSTVDVPSDIFITTESGLQYKDTKIGTGAVPVPGDTVRVHYTGWLEDFESEKKFDSSYDRRSPLVFKVGVKQVIAGSCKPQYITLTL